MLNIFPRLGSNKMEVSGLSKTSCVLKRVEWEDTHGHALAEVTHSSGALCEGTELRCQEWYCVVCVGVPIPQSWPLCVDYWPLWSSFHISKSRVVLVPLLLWRARQNQQNAQDTECLGHRRCFGPYGWWYDDDDNGDGLWWWGDN